MLLKTIKILASKYAVLGARFSLLRLPLQGFFRRYFFCLLAPDISAKTLIPCKHCNIKNLLNSNLCKECSSLLSDSPVFFPEQIKPLYIVITTTIILTLLYLIIKRSNKAADKSQPPHIEKTKKDPKLLHALNVLELTEKAEFSEIKKSWKNLLKKYHPDKIFHNNEKQKTICTEKTTEINNAYKYLKTLYQKR